jgi:hypothetical protein
MTDTADAAFTAGNRWSNWADRIAQDDQAQRVKNQQERERQGDTFRPEMFETYRNQRGQAHTTMHAAVSDGAATLVHEASSLPQQASGQGATLHQSAGPDEVVTADEAFAAGETITADDTITADETITANETITVDETITAGEAITAEEALTVDETITADENITGDEALTVDEPITADETITAGEVPTSTKSTLQQRYERIRDSSLRQWFHETHSEDPQVQRNAQMRLMLQVRLRAARAKQSELRQQRDDCRIASDGAGAEDARKKAKHAGSRARRLQKLIEGMDSVIDKTAQGLVKSWEEKDRTLEEVLGGLELDKTGDFGLYNNEDEEGGILLAEGSE